MQARFLQLADQAMIRMLYEGKKQVYYIVSIVRLSNLNK